MVKAFTHWGKIDLADGELLVSEILIFIQQVKIFQALNEEDDDHHRRCHWRYHKRHKHRKYHY